MFLENQLKYIIDFSSLCDCNECPCTLITPKAGIFLSDCNKMLAVREIFHNSVMNDASLHLLKVICGL